MSTEEGPFAIYSVEKVSEVISKVKEHGWIGKYLPMLDEIDKRLREIFLDVSKIAPVLESGVVALRDRSMQLIFDTLAVALKENFKDVLYDAGEEVGASFAHEMIYTLRKLHLLLAGEERKGHEAMLQTWAGFDFSANWAKIEVDCSNLRNKKLKVKFIDNFLTRGYEEDTHRHCKFIEGYIDGLINQMFLEWSRLVRKVTGTKPQPVYRCLSVTELSTEKSNCVFDIELSEEELVESCDKLMQSLEQYRQGYYNDSCINVRTVLEYALKEKVGFDVKTFRHFKALYRIYKNEGYSLKNYGLANDAYFKTSQVVHGIRSATKEEAWQSISVARKWILGLEEIEMPPDKKRLLKELVQKIPEKQVLRIEPSVEILIDKIGSLETSIKDLRLEVRVDHNRIIKQTEEIKEICVRYANEYPRQLADILEIGSENLKKILAGFRDELKDLDPKASQEASRWHSLITRGADFTANIVQLFTFITGVMSMPELMKSEYVAMAVRFIKSIANLLGELFK